MKRIPYSFIILFFILTFTSCSKSSSLQADSNKNEQSNELLLSEKLIYNDGSIGSTNYYVYDDKNRVEYYISIGGSDELMTYFLSHNYYNDDGTINYSLTEQFQDWSIVGMTDNYSGQSKYDYEYQDGKLIQEGNDLITIKYYYDSNSAQPSKTETIQDGKTVTDIFEYDANGNLISDTCIWGDTSYTRGTTYYTYDDSGNRLTEKKENGTSNDYIYDDDGKLIKLQYTDHHWEYYYTSDPAESRANLAFVSSIFNIDDAIAAGTTNTSESDLFDEFINGNIEANGNGFYYEDEFWANEVPIITDGVPDWDQYCAKSERCDLNNDGDEEVIIYDGRQTDYMYLDIYDNEVIVMEMAPFGKLAHISYDNAEWIVYYDTSHTGRTNISLKKYNGTGNVVDSFDLDCFYSDEFADSYDSNSTFTYRDENITMEEYEQLLSEIFKDSSIVSIKSTDLHSNSFFDETHDYCLGACSLVTTVDGSYFLPKYEQQTIRDLTTWQDTGIMYDLGVKIDEHAKIAAATSVELNVDEYGDSTIPVFEYTYYDDFKAYKDLLYDYGHWKTADDGTFMFYINGGYISNYVIVRFDSEGTVTFVMDNYSE